MANDDFEWSEADDFEWSEAPQRKPNSPPVPWGGMDAKQPFSSKPFTKKDVDSGVESVQDYYSSLNDNIPLAGWGRKAAAAGVAGIESAVTDKDFGTIYDEITARKNKEMADRQERSPTADVLGGVTAAMMVPVKKGVPPGWTFGGAAERIGLNAADAAGLGDTKEEMASNGVSGLGISTAMEAIPALGKLSTVIGKGAKAYGPVTKGPLKDPTHIKHGTRFAENPREKEIPQWMVDAAAGGTAAYFTPGDIKSKAMAGTLAAGNSRLAKKATQPTVRKNLERAGTIMERIGELPVKYQKLLTGSPQQIELTHYLLQKEDPEYRALVDGP